MSPRVVAVVPDTHPFLRLTFANGEERRFDLSPYLDKGIFRELQDPAYFQRVGAVSGFIAWPHGQDLSPDTLYLLSVPLEASADPSLRQDALPVV